MVGEATVGFHRDSDGTTIATPVRRAMTVLVRKHWRFETEAHTPANRDLHHQIQLNPYQNFKSWNLVILSGFLIQLGAGAS